MRCLVGCPVAKMFCGITYLCSMQMTYEFFKIFELSWGLCLKGERAEVEIRVWNCWPQLVELDS